ncbi:hypothetical protein FS837_011931 [Tulasnella sp. UAMH 9824]|nr:hypothetical protein FS837_011931 [Tulasnella sp. UAMH 9824]
MIVEWDCLGISYDLTNGAPAMATGATDVAITVLMLWKICQRGKTYSSKTQKCLARLRNITIEAAVPPTICVILKMCFTFGMGKKNLVSHWFAIITPTLYVWSMMFTLNS